MMIFFWLILGFGIYYFLKNNGSFDHVQQNNNNSIEILKNRYVNGEIDDETYQKMLKILKN